MSNNNVETVSSSIDRIKLGLAVLVIVAGIVGYSMLDNQPTIVRVGVFMGGLVIAAVIAWFSEPGRRTLSFGRDSYNEVKRVVRSEEHTSELQSLMRISYAVFCLKKK